MKATNNLVFVRSTIHELEMKGLVVWIIGGWAEELVGLQPPRPHKDIDLLLIENDTNIIDNVLSHWSWQEIQAKHLPHKRAYMREGLMVELFLGFHRDNKLITNFWGTTQFIWPDDTLEHRIDELPVASRKSLIKFRAEHACLMQDSPWRVTQT